MKLVSTGEGEREREREKERERERERKREREDDRQTGKVQGLFLNVKPIIHTLPF